MGTEQQDWNDRWEKRREKVTDQAARQVIDFMYPPLVEIMTRVVEIEKQTTETNGRVTAHDDDIDKIRIALAEQKGRAEGEAGAKVVAPVALPVATNTQDPSGTITLRIGFREAVIAVVLFLIVVVAIASGHFEWIHGIFRMGGK